MAWLPILEVITFSLALWLGLYLMSRDLTNPQLRYAGLGLLFYAFSVATGSLLPFAPNPTAEQVVARLHWPVLFLPGLFWLGAIVYLLPEDSASREPLVRVWLYVVLPVALPLFLISAGANLVFDFATIPPLPGPAYPLFVSLLVLPLLAALFLVWRAFRAARLKEAFGLLLAATLFVGLGIGLLAYPLNWLPRPWVLLGISIDFVLLGIAVALLDAFDQGKIGQQGFALVKGIEQSHGDA